jgi:hypothetical protein
MSTKVQVGSYNPFQEGQRLKHRNDDPQPQEISFHGAADDEKWNDPRSNIMKTLATFCSFLVMGANDSAYGVGSLPRFAPPGVYTNPMKLCSH